MGEQEEELILRRHGVQAQPFVPGQLPAGTEVGMQVPVIAGDQVLMELQIEFF